MNNVSQYTRISVILNETAPLLLSEEVWAERLSRRATTGSTAAYRIPRKPVPYLDVIDMGGAFEFRDTFVGKPMFPIAVEEFPNRPGHGSWMKAEEIHPRPRFRRILDRLLCR